ncbi:flagellar motor protein MotD [Mizugakiibacter sediminis]|uniref:Flagellar motor protein MotB n=1 Tax=Mizugakiibacter sediminis TaxID=1475481 RepID=A0A0K8QPE5_9GAMM|nr:flagellar motor protein MotD [Mizugakiibacter sediminis]GAP66759.1 flagellar motor protein MotD [Mizugakiibacter sediminis]
MARKHLHEEHVNHERWAIPYGDLITLLLAFFVVMYSISSVNEGKYRVLAQSIASAFNGSPKVIEPVQAGAQPTMSAQTSAISSIQAAAPSAAPIPLIPVPVPAQKLPPPGKNGGREGGDDAGLARAHGETAGLKRIADQIERALGPLIARQLIALRRADYWLEIEIKTDILFPSGVAALSPQAVPVLQQLADILRPFPNPLRIEGYTDDVPIATLAFPSNWELSAARAASVVRLLAAGGVDPQRMAILGWGEYRPVASNASEAGRNRNRRVLIVVLSSSAVPERFYSDRPEVPTQTAAGVDAAAEAAPAATPPATGAAPAANGWLPVLHVVRPVTNTK